MIRKWINRLIDDRLNSRLSELPDPVEPEIDYGAFDYGEIADHMSISDIADYIEVDASEVAEHLDISDVASEIDLYELADNFSASDIADEMSIDASDIAEHVDVSDIANELDLVDLASELNMDTLAEHVDLDEVTGKLQDEMKTLKNTQAAIISALENIELAVTEMRLVIDNKEE